MAIQKVNIAKSLRENRLNQTGGDRRFVSRPASKNKKLYTRKQKHKRW